MLGLSRRVICHQEAPILFEPVRPDRHWLPTSSLPRPRLINKYEVNLASLCVERVFIPAHESLPVLFLVEGFISVVLTVSVIGVFVRVVFFRPVLFVIT